MTLKPSGGRGKKAPYETVVIRVPVPLISEVEEIVDSYRNDVISGTTVAKKSVSRNDAIEEAKKILRGKKSAKQSLLKLLQVLYGNDLTEDDLK